MDLIALKRANNIENELTKITLVLTDLDVKSNYEFGVNYSSGSQKRSITDLLSPELKKLITNEIVTALITRSYLLERELKSL